MANVPYYLVKKIHKGCIASNKYMDIDSINSDMVLCMQCESEQSEENVMWNQIKKTEVAEKLERLGILCPSDQQERKKAVRQMNKTIEVLKNCYSGYNSILDNKPKPYPTSFAMSDLSKKKTHNTWPPIRSFNVYVPI